MIAVQRKWVTPGEAEVAPRLAEPRPPEEAVAWPTPWPPRCRRERRRLAEVVSILLLPWLLKE